MSYEEQNPGDCPGCREYEQERLRLLAERDAAFKMSRCECGPDECCANLVRLHKEIARLQGLLRTCVDKMIDYEVDDTHENADFIVDCAAAAGPYPDE